MQKYEVDVSKLDSLNVYQLREVGFKIGVKNPTTMTTTQLKDAITQITLGTSLPYIKKKSGRPRKKELIPDNKWNHLIGFENTFEQHFPTIYANKNFAQSPDQSVFQSLKSTIWDGYVYSFDNNLYFFPNTKCWSEIKYALINPNLPLFYQLQSGDYITCKIDFLQTPCVVNEIIKISPPTQDAIDEPFRYTLPQLDFVPKQCPIKKGNRIFIHGLSFSGQTYLCNSFAKNFDDQAAVVYFSIAKKPEERITLKDAEYFFSTFDVDEQSIVFYFHILCERVKRLCALGQDVVFIIDDLNTLFKSIYTHSTQNHHQPAEVVYNQITQQIKRLLASSGAFDKGSITLIVASFDDEHDTLLKEILCNVNKMCNTHIALDRNAFMHGETYFLVEEDTYTESVRSV